MGISPTHRSRPPADADAAKRTKLDSMDSVWCACAYFLCVVLLALSCIPCTRVRGPHASCAHARALHTHTHSNASARRRFIKRLATFYGTIRMRPRTLKCVFRGCPAIASECITRKARVIDWATPQGHWPQTRTSTRSSRRSPLLPSIVFESRPTIGQRKTCPNEVVEIFGNYNLDSHVFAGEKASCQCLGTGNGTHSRPSLPESVNESMARAHTCPHIYIYI